MFQYIAWGDPTNTISDSSLFGFITATGELLGMLVFIFFLVGTILNLKMTKSFAYTEKPFGWIVIGVALGLMCGLFTSYGFEYNILSKYGVGSVKEISNEILYLNLNPIFVITGMLRAATTNDNYITIGNGILTISFQFIGAFLGALLAYLFFKRLINQQEDPTSIRGCFYTIPSCKKYPVNLFNEFCATFIFSIIIFLLWPAFNEDQIALKIITISLVVGTLGYGIGGVTGYALNPIRDLAPRIVYFVLMNKRDTTCKDDWKYSFVPILGPTFGAILAFIIMPGFLY